MWDEPHFNIFPNLWNAKQKIIGLSQDGSLHVSCDLVKCIISTAKNFVKQQNKFNMMTSTANNSTLNSCQFYVQKKKRFCKFLSIEGRQFCAEHLPRDVTTGEVCNIVFYQISTQMLHWMTEVMIIGKRWLHLSLFCDCGPKQTILVHTDTWIMDGDWRELRSS